MAFFGERGGGMGGGTSRGGGGCELNPTSLTVEMCLLSPPAVTKVYKYNITM
jgi:hypothetical protein